MVVLELHFPPMGLLIWNISILRRLFCGPTLTLAVGVHPSVLAITSERDMLGVVQASSPSSCVDDLRKVELGDFISLCR